MAKIKRNTKVAKQNRTRVSYHRDWNRILIKESIMSTMQAKVIDHKPSSSQCQSAIDSENFQEVGARIKLQRWALRNNISKNALTALLKVLISIGLTWLPKDSRTLLSTPRSIHLSTLSNGKIW